MKTSRETYTAETPALVFPEPLTVKPIVQSLPVPPWNINARGNRGSKMKCITRMWDLNIPTELLQEILSRLGLKDNLQAYAVCKTWSEASVSVRKLKPCPWLLYPAPEESSATGSHYILFDPLGCQTYQQTFPESKNHELCFSRDGWLLVRNSDPSVFFLNPFTREHINIPWGSPEFSSYYCLAFSDAPTSSSCVVISFRQVWCHDFLLIHTWRPGETVWTTHRFEKQLPLRIFTQCVFSNGMFYWLSLCGYLGVFDPSRVTWNFLPLKPCCADFARPMLMTEHEGDIFVMYKFGRSYQPVFKLNLKRKTWEEKKELGGLTVFASSSTPLTRAGLSAEEKNIIYEQLGSNYYLADDKSFICPPWEACLIRRTAWVDPPQNVKLLLQQNQE